MLKVILNRILQIIPTLFVIVSLTFILTRIIPGDAATAMVGDQADPVMIEKIREEMGLNDSYLEQYMRYLKGILMGDFGKSYYFNKPALTVIAEHLPNTLLLAVSSITLALIFGLAIGIVSAVRRGGFFDYFFTIISLFGVSAPVFWTGMMLVMYFSTRLGWLPTFGIGSLENGLWDVVSHMIMPCICLMLNPLATFSRITRSSMIDALTGDYIRSLRSRGVFERILIFKHALKNAAPSIITVVGMQLATSVAGAVLTETIFSWPGMGMMISGAIDHRDYALIQATVLVVALAFVLINLLTDLIYMVLNPKYAHEVKKGGI